MTKSKPAIQALPIDQAAEQLRAAIEVFQFSAAFDQHPLARALHADLRTLRVSLEHVTKELPS